MRSLLVAVALAALTGAAHATLIYDTGGFEAYSLGSVYGQNANAVGSAAWYDPGRMFLGNSGTVGIEAAPTGGKALAFHNPNFTESDAEVDFSNLVGKVNIATVSFDLFRVGATDANNMYWWPAGNNPWEGLSWDNDHNAPGKIIPFWDYSKPITSMPMVDARADMWQNVTMQFDLANGLGTAWVDGAKIADGFNIKKGAEFTGWFFGDWQTTGGTNGQTVYVDNLRIMTGNNAGEVPEPGSLALMAGGLLPLLGLLRRK